MDYGRLARKDLQALCKKHGIPANKTNACMAEALGALLNEPNETEEQPVESIPDPAEVVQSKSKKRAGKSKTMTDVLTASAVDDLSSQLAQSTLSAETVPLDDDLCATVVEAMIETPAEEDPQEIIAVDTVKVPRRARGARTPKDSAAPALTEVTLEVVLQMPDLTVVEPDQLTFSRRTPKLNEEARSEVTATPPLDPYRIRTFAAADLSQGENSAPVEEEILFQEVLREKISTLPANVMVAEDLLQGENSSPFVEEILFQEAPVEEISVEEVTAKKPKAKGKRSKRGKPAVSPVTLPVLQDGPTPVLSITDVPYSPTLGLADTTQENVVAPNRSPTPEDEDFEFKPYPQSFVEIMTPGKPLLEATKGGCQHRIGRKSGKSCASCTAERKLASPLQTESPLVEILPVSVNSLPRIAAGKIEEVLKSPPIKQSDGKENSLKHVDYLSMSIRQLQKMAKRKNSRVKA